MSNICKWIICVEIGKHIIISNLIVCSAKGSYHGLGTRFNPRGPVGFGMLPTLSGSKFPDLGLGMLPRGPRRPVVHLAGGRVRLHLPGADHHLHPLLDQAYGAREVGNLLIHSRVGQPPGADRAAPRYSGADCSEVLRATCARPSAGWRDAPEHLGHPVLFSTAQHLGQSWLVSLAAFLDSCALLTVGGRRFPCGPGKAHLPHGVRLLEI